MVVAASGAPTVDYIALRAEEAERRDARRNAKWDRVEQLRYRLHEVPIPERFKHTTRQVKIPLVDDTLRVVVSAIAQAFPTVQRPPASTGQEEQGLTSRVEKWLMAALVEMDRAEDSHRAYVDEIDQAVTFGMAVPKWLYLPDAWEAQQFEYRQLTDPKTRRKRRERDSEYNARVQAYREQAPLPFVWVTPDPRTFHGWYELRKLVEVVEISKRPRYDLARRYGSKSVRFDSQSGKLYNARFGEPVAESSAGAEGLADLVEFIEYWDRGWYTCVADNTILDQFRHDYPSLPHKPYFGLSTSSRAPEHEAQGLTDNILDLAEAWDYALTMWLNCGALNAFPMGTAEYREGALPTDDEGKALEMIEWEPGVFKVLPPGSKLGWMVHPEFGKDLKDLQDVIGQLARQASGVPEVLKGNAERAQTAWGQAQQLMVATRRSVDPVSGNCALSLTSRAEWLLEVLEKRHGDTVYLLGDLQNKRGKKRGKLALGPDDIKGYYAVTIDIAPLTADKRIQEGQFWGEQQKAGAVSMRYHREVGLQIQAPEEMDAEVKVEQFRASEQYNQWLFGLAQKVIEGKYAQELQLAGVEQAPVEGQMPPGVQGEQMGAVPPEAMAGQMQPAVQPRGARPIEGAPSPMAPVPGLGLPVNPRPPEPMVIG